MTDSVPEIKDRAIFIGWISGLIIMICVLWIIIRPFQARQTLRAVNKVLIATGDPRRINAHVSRPLGKHGPLGYWYSTVESIDQLFVFGVMTDGILVPCGAVVSANGKVEEIIPLSIHARQVLKDMPDGVVRVYINRIERGIGR